MTLNEDDIIQLNTNIFFRYSNIIKNSYKLDIWGNFVIKNYISIDGDFEGGYTSVTKNIFKQKDILPYTIQFNPEKLI